MSAFSLNNVVYTSPTVPSLTTIGNIAIYSDTLGTLSQNATTAINAGSIQAGLSGSSGSLISYPQTSGTGSLNITAASNVGNFSVSIANASNAQTTTYTIPDPSTTVSSFILNRTNKSFNTGQNITGSINITGTNTSTSYTSGSLVVSGSLGLSNSMYIGNTVNIINTTNSTSIGTGSLVVGGGIGLAKDLYVAGLLNVTGSSNIKTLTVSVTQSAHGFSVGNWLYFNGTIYILASDTSSSLAEVVGIVTTVTNINNFILTKDGYISGLSNLVSGTIYYLGTTPGLMISNAETTVTYINKPLFVADSTGTGYILNYRGEVVPSSVYSLVSGTFGNLSITNSLYGSTETTFLQNSIDSVSSTSGSLVISGSLGLSNSLTTNSLQISSNIVTSLNSELYISATNSFIQQGPKQYGSGFIGAIYGQGSVVISRDSSTSVMCDSLDNGIGALWIYVRTSSTNFIQLGQKLVGSGYSGLSGPGHSSVAISYDGSIIAVGSPADNNNTGATWIFVRTGPSSVTNVNAGQTGQSYYQLGSKLVGTGFSGIAGSGSGSGLGVSQGTSVSTNSDGSTISVSGPYDNGNVGATWIFVRTGSTYIQQAKLVGSGSSSSSSSGQSSVSLSLDGNTLAVGSSNDNSFGSTWIFIRTNGSWSQQGSKLIGSGFSGSGSGSGTGSGSGQGSSVSVSADTLIIGSPGDNNGNGASWIFIRTVGSWTQYSTKLIGSGFSGFSGFGQSVSLDLSGTVAVIGAPSDNSNSGAIYVFNRIRSTYVQISTKLIGTGFSGPALFGSSVCIDAGASIVVRATDNINGSLGPAIYTFQTVQKQTIINGPTTFQEPVITTTTTTTSSIVMPTTAISDNNITSSSQISINPVNSTSVLFGYTQQNIKLVGNGYSGGPNQGVSIGISTDGSTIVSGGRADNGSIGATWVFVKTGSTYTQFSSKLVGTGFSGASGQGQVSGVSVSSDGSVVAVSGNGDNGNTGALWVFIRSGSGYVQQGSKLIGSGFSGIPGFYISSISSDGSTIALGGQSDNASLLIGATWVFIRSGPGYVQQGSKLVGSGFSGSPNQGSSNSFSADGNTLAIGAVSDNGLSGATWIFVRTNGSWSQQGPKLVGIGFSGNAQQGTAMSLSLDGNTVAIASQNDFGNIGAIWIFTRSAGSWSQQGSKLTGSGYSGTPRQGFSVALAASQTSGTLIVGGYTDNANQGASWLFVRSGSDTGTASWSQVGSKIVGSNYNNPSGQGTGVAIDTGNNFVVGGYIDGQNGNTNIGAVWHYSLNNGSVTLPVAGSLNINGPLNVTVQSQHYMILGSDNANGSVNASIQATTATLLTTYYTYIGNYGSSLSNPGPGQILINTSGLYFASMTMAFTNTSAGSNSRSCYILKGPFTANLFLTSNTVAATDTSASTGRCTLNSNLIRYLDAGTTLLPVCYHNNSGVNLSTDNAFINYFFAVKLF